MSYVPVTLRRLVRERAQYRCEYCLIHEDDSLFAHEIDHVIAVKHGGQTAAENLCYGCYVCNRSKGSDLSSIDPQTNLKTFLFDPRHDRWHDHFEIVDGRIEGKTPAGRTTAALLEFNIPQRIEARSALIAAGRYGLP